MHIWKYKLAVGLIGIEIPAGAKVLSVQEQDNEPVMWLEVDPSSPLKTRFFTGAMTGVQLPSVCVQGKYLGTCLLNGGTFVVHIYEHIKPRCAAA